jgi:hypothetical protein
MSDRMLLPTLLTSSTWNSSLGLKRAVRLCPLRGPGAAALDVVDDEHQPLGLVPGQLLGGFLVDELVEALGGRVLEGVEPHVVLDREPLHLGPAPLPPEVSLEHDAEEEAEGHHRAGAPRPERSGDEGEEHRDQEVGPPAPDP